MAGQRPGAPGGDGCGPRSGDCHHAEYILTAKEILIQRQDTHLDSLAERLREPRVCRVIEPMLAGFALGDLPADDRQFVVDLGLARRDPAGGLVIANPIYREVIPRVLANSPQDSLPHISPTWLKPNGSLDAGKLLEAFLAFWRQHGQPLLGSVHYHEIAAQFVMMVFLHRVVNGNGTFDHENAIGTRRMDTNANVTPPWVLRLPPSSCRGLHGAECGSVAPRLQRCWRYL